MSTINFQRTYSLGEAYEAIKERAFHYLEKYWEFPNLITFNDADRSVTFSSERLIPEAATRRPRVMLLFSNPHPLSVHQGMFLSPNSIGRESLFWPAMRDAGWMAIPEEVRDPKALAEICLQVQYPGPFELVFYCYYAFPTEDPDHIRKIFGRAYFNQVIEPQSRDEFRQTVKETKVEAVVAFNKAAFNHASKEPVKRYIDRLKGGKLVRSQVKGAGWEIATFLTYPTGWRYHKQYRELRKTSLEAIRAAILSGSRIP